MLSVLTFYRHWCIVFKEGGSHCESRVPFFLPSKTTNDEGESIIEKLKVFLAVQEAEEQSVNQENEWDCWIEKGWSQF